MSKKLGISLIVIMISLVLTITIAVSYAMWTVTNEQEESNIVQSGCFSMEITSERNAINLNNAYPISDTEANSLTPYTFTITNTCSIFAKYTVNLEMLSGSTLNTNYIATKVNNEEKAILGSLPAGEKQINDSTESRTIVTGVLGPNDETDYTLRVWMDSTVTTGDAEGKILNAKLVIISQASSYSPVNEGITLLNEALLANEYQTTDIDHAKAKIAAKGAVNTNTIAPTIEWVENDGAETTNTQIRPKPENIGSYGVVSEYTKVKIATSYTFNSSNGQYTIVNISFLDPTTLDYENNDYYYVGDDLTVNSYNQIVVVTRNTSSDLYKIKSVTAEDTYIDVNGTQVSANQYNFNVIKKTQDEKESDTSDKGLYLAEDDFGDTYFYRGNVKNNFVYYAGFYWRVMRINGNVTVRMLYMGPDPNAIGETTGINSQPYPFNEVSSNPAYAGYMYGSTLNVSAALTHANEVDSDVKKVIDSWYETNILNKGYAGVIGDGGFCNERSIKSGNGYSSSSSTYFTESFNYKCPNIANDLFTSTTASFGNKALKYAISLPTRADLMYAGMHNSLLNRLSFVYSSVDYHTMTPGCYLVTYNSPVFTRSLGNGYLTGSVASNLLYVRPVINLKSDTEILSGNGTANDPFVIDV